MTTFNQIQNTSIKALTRMPHEKFCAMCNDFYLSDKTELQEKVGAAKIFYVQALRNQNKIERRFPYEREMIIEQVNHLLAEYLETQTLLNLHLQAEINAGDLNNFRERLQTNYATLTAKKQN